MGSKTHVARNSFGYFGNGHELANPLLMNPLNLSGIGNLPFLTHPELFLPASPQNFSTRHSTPKHRGGRGKKGISSAPIPPQENIYSPQSSQHENENIDSDEDTGCGGDISFANDSPDSGGVDSTNESQRSQKRPIPNEQKDNKYFERRRRNNLAAKKSRDARKTREDQLAMRVAHLEKENAIFRAQVAILREEMSVLRVCICQKANGNFSAEENL